MKITFISDTHTKHNQITQDLPGGDLILHTGDISSLGREHEIENFFKWFSKLDNYTNKVFIAGNHDFGFENNMRDVIMEIVYSFGNIKYLQDSYTIIDGVKIYGSPWQPEFNGWAFNLPRNGDILKSKWDNIPDDTDIVLTHGPVFGHLDRIKNINENLGCELLAERFSIFKPKIHVCGHIHSGNGFQYSDGINYFNASVLNESYNYHYKPLTIDWDKKTNEVIIL